LHGGIERWVEPITQKCVIQNMVVVLVARGVTDQIMIKCVRTS
jgi:hypothetical protein